MSVVRASYSIAIILLLGFHGGHLTAQASEPHALDAIRAAVNSELQANRTDKSIWTYRDVDNVPGKNATYRTIETRQGSLRRMIELNGKPLSPAEDQAEINRIASFVDDPGAQARARKGSAHDDAQATELLTMLPQAFLWTTVHETHDLLTLSYRPNPGFSPPNIEARIMGMMAGEVTISRQQQRIQTLKGQLTENVSIGFGLVKMYKGGTFDIERREVGGGHWQINETHVHIGGHALFFKSIGTQQDEMKTEWKPSPDETLFQAAHTLGAHP